MHPTSSPRYRLRPPPTPSGAPAPHEDFLDLVDLAERIAELKWLWDTKFKSYKDQWSESKSIQGEPDEPVYRLAKWMHVPWEPSTSPTADRPPSTHIRPGLYVSAINQDGGIGESRPWYQIASLEALVAARVPPALGAKSSTTATDSQKPEATNSPDPIWVEDKVVRAVVRAMLTRPLVLLAGISGSGKTQLARRLGLAWAAGVFGKKDTENSAILKLEKGVTAIGEGKKWIGPEKDGWREIGDIEVEAMQSIKDLRARFGFIAVQSDWTDASHLWGYHVPLPAEAEGFYGTAALGVFLSAQQDAKHQHFLLLDEMNLSRPEHYASDLLSAMEVPGKAVIHLHRSGSNVRLRGAEIHGSNAEGAQVVPDRIAWPEGLLVIGTVNVDETTFSFAPKVLDRAALLEFTDVDLEKVFGKNPKYEENIAWFKAVQSVCRPYNLHLGYRAAREVLKGLALADHTDRSDVLDLQLCNKVLPRVRGPRASVERLLLRLLSIARNKYKVAADHSVVVEPAMGTHKAHQTYGPEASEAKNESGTKAEAKINEMLRRAYAVGFTSYFG